MIIRRRLSEQIGMGTCLKQFQYKSVMINAINQKPVRLDMALPYPAVLKVMVMMLLLKRLTISKLTDNLLELP